MTDDVSMSEANELLDTDADILSSHFEISDLETAITILEKLAENPKLKKLAQSSEIMRRLMAAGKSAFIPSLEDRKQHSKAKKQNKRECDLSLLEESGIRKMRQVKMVGMVGGSVDLPKPPRVGFEAANEKFIEADDARIAAEMADEAKKLQESTSSTGFTGDSLRSPSSAKSVFTHVESDNAAFDQLPPPKKLNYKRSCHICGQLFTDLHAFYDQLCLTCASLNYSKRFSKADMTGRVCLVTGARVKIGYAIALKLIRMNAAKVIVTTRFPHDAARRFAAEPDSAVFQSRLTVYGLDFRDIRMMHHFCAHIRAKETRLDVIINNAAQTVRKPPGFYEHLMTGEGAGKLEPEVLEKVEVVDVFRVGEKYLFGSPDVAAAEAKKLLAGREHLMQKHVENLHVIENKSRNCQVEHTVELSTSAPCKESVLMATPAMNATNFGTDLMPANPGTAAILSVQSNGEIVNEAAAMSQIPLLSSDITASALATELFPKGLYDRDDQQVDLRTQNSWNLEMGQISTVEMMECHVINTFAPWVLISELKELMEASGPINGTALPEGAYFDKYIVNVSAMEGQFYRNKTIFHPHTNMAKASLNMMTRTAAAGFAAIGIFMTAVDTGWITDEQPQHLWEKRANQPPPLDEWDAAQRVLDPVLCGVRGEDRLWGVFLKNYRPTRW